MNMIAAMPENSVVAVMTGTDFKAQKNGIVVSDENSTKFEQCLSNLVAEESEIQVDIPQSQDLEDLVQKLEGLISQLVLHKPASQEEESSMGDLLHKLMLMLKKLESKLSDNSEAVAIPLFLFSGGQADVLTQDLTQDIKQALDLLQINGDSIGDAENAKSLADSLIMLTDEIRRYINSGEEQGKEPSYTYARTTGAVEDKSYELLQFNARISDSRDNKSGIIPVSTGESNITVNAENAEEPVLIQSGVKSQEVIFSDKPEGGFDVDTKSLKNDIPAEETDSEPTEIFSKIREMSDTLNLQKTTVKVTMSEENSVETAKPITDIQKPVIKQDSEISQLTGKKESDIGELPPTKTVNKAQNPENQADLFAGRFVRTTFDGEIKLAEPQNVGSRLMTEVYLEIGKQLQNANPKTEFTMVLNPESLGKITVKLVSEGGKITVGIIAENQLTQQMLNNRGEQLSQALRQNNIQLENYQVVTHEENLFSENYDGSSKNPYNNQQQNQQENDEDQSFIELFESIAVM